MKNKLNFIGPLLEASGTSRLVAGLALLCLAGSSNELQAQAPPSQAPQALKLAQQSQVEAANPASSALVHLASFASVPLALLISGPLEPMVSLLAGRRAG